MIDKLKALFIAISVTVIGLVLLVAIPFITLAFSLFLIVGFLFYGALEYIEEEKKQK